MLEVEEGHYKGGKFTLPPDVDAVICSSHVISRPFFAVAWGNAALRSALDVVETSVVMFGKATLSCVAAFVAPSIAPSTAPSTQRLLQPQL